MSKIALIFGGSGGIGQAICSELEKKGIIVYSTSYQSKQASQNERILPCDVTKFKDIKRVVSYILKMETKIDIVINSVTPPLKLKTIENLSVEEFRQDIETILLGGINIAQAIIPIMKTQKQGVIINILSLLVKEDVSTRLSSYTSAKYGLLGFTKCLAKELMPFNIAVFGISPSFVETNLIKAFPDKLIEIEKNKRRDRKLTQPIEVAQVILDLIRNPQKYKSGENLDVN
mgnify:CR=1 FL=1